MAERRIDQATALAGLEDGAATVVSRGTGAQARELVALGRELELPVLEDFALSQALARMPVGTTLPEPMFKALGVLLEFVFEQDAKLAARPDQQKK